MAQMPSLLPSGSVRKCQHPGCSTSIPGGRFLCMPHWQQVPWALKVKVEEAMTAFNRKQDPKQVLLRQACYSAVLALTRWPKHLLDRPPQPAA